MLSLSLKPDENHAGHKEEDVESDAQSTLAVLAKKMMLGSAIQSAAAATTASAPSAGRAAQVASAMTAYSAQSQTSSEDARLVRPTGGSPAPRKPMGAELEPSQDAAPASTPMPDFATMRAQKASATDMDQSAGKIAQQAQVNAVLSA